MLLSLRQSFIVATWLLLSLVSGRSAAQVRDLGHAIELAIANYPSIKAGNALVRSKEEERDAVLNQYLPRLSLQHQYTYGTSNSVTGSFYPNAGTVLSPSGGIRKENIYDGVFGSYTGGLIEWDFFNFGKVSAQNKAASADIETARALLENEMFQHKVKVTDAYLQLLIVERLKYVQENNLHRAIGFKKAVDAGVVAGIRPGVDSSLAQAEYAKAMILVMESQRNVKSQQYRMEQLLGLAKDVGLLLTDSSRFFNSLPNLPESPASSSDNPLLKISQSRINFSFLKGKAIRRSFMPSVSITTSAWGRGSGVSNVDESYRTDFQSGTEYQVYNYMVGLSTRWALTDFAQINNRYKAEEYLRQRHTELYQEQQLELSRQLKDAEMQFMYMKQQAEFAPVQLLAAKQAYDQASARYSSGLADLPTLLTAMVALSRAEADLTISYLNTWRSVLMVAASEGNIDLFLSQGGE